MKTRIAAALLALLMLISTLAACGGGKDTADTTTAPGGDVTTTTTAAETEAPEPTMEELLGFPAEDNGNKQINILSNSNQSYEWSLGEQNGELVNDATYLRDTMIEEYLGIKFNIILEDGNYPARSAWNDKLSNTINAGDDAYDIVNSILVVTMHIITQNLFLEGGQLPHANFDQEWWLSDMYGRYGIDDKVYCFMGDFSLSLYKDLSVIFFNRDIWAAKNPGVDLFELVRKNEWTLDKFIELTTNMAEDLNGDGKYEEGDMLTFVGEYVPLGTWQTAMDISVVEMNAEGVPTVTGLNERFIDAYDKLSAYHQNTNGVLRYNSIDDQTFLSMKGFANSSVATMCNFLYATEHIRDMEDDYGIIPIPKYDADQADYVSQLGTSTSAIFVPNTNKDPELTSKVMEALAYLGRKEVTPKYYEVALKTKYASDENVQEMLDLIRDAATIDFMFVFGTAISGTPNRYFRFTEFIPSLTTKFKAEEKVYTKRVEEMVAAFEKLDS